MICIFNSGTSHSTAVEVALKMCIQFAFNQGQKITADATVKTLEDEQNVIHFTIAVNDR
ncbi:MAG TPA: hypothetical protein VNS32_21225 [Flavisolibacter sp.]|nr:hypothetical protein [Flavisolibacter sp.]